MEREKRHLSARHLPVLVLAALAVVIMSFSVSRLSHAAGEPTVAVTMDDVSLTSGQTAVVTFSFSAVPFGFTNDDVDLSDANGTLSPVTATPDPRIYTATFTPNSGVNDPTNIISVGTQWNDPGGVSPVAAASSANFSIQTSGGGGGSCPASSVTLGSPNGGDTLVSGSDVNVFWSMTGCQATSLLLLLSSDGGASYGVVATSSQPTYGYYRWTVPDTPSSSSRLQVKLLGSGGTELASDESDGTFVIQSAPDPAGGGTAAAPATSTPPTASPPTPTPAPAPSSGPTTPSASDTLPISATATPPISSAPTPAQKRPAAPMAPPMPNIPLPQAQTTTAPDTSTQPTDTPMKDVNQNQSTVSLDGVQGAIETATGFAPSSLELVFSFLLGALAMLGLVLGAQKAIKRNKAKSTKRCHRCQGTGEEPAEKKAIEKCDECDGTGQVEDEDEPGVECKHCAGEGEDPCHRCKGLGKDAAGRECPACKGGGKTLTGKLGKDGEDEVADCEICHGEGELSASVKKMIPCEKCGGTGKI